ncbi:CaiB/BaiF CoA transferase family protein [Pseudomonas fluorescens]|uniref:CaiB/BaiF CoA transferase family protein n=1 Tax=Pseudomonas fluorescens TaxID=294 RepID=UPI001912B935|nr:CoA transferase [Pseudomonas fluorescens]
MSKVLKGIRVLDFGRYIAGPFCGALLADLGADVIRIDRVGGSEDRFVMPVTPDGDGALFLQVNRNKRSITLDIDSSEGKDIVRRLVLTADVVIANMPAQTLAKLGLDYDSLRELKADIVLVAPSAFGGSDAMNKRLGFDGIGQAMSGGVHISGVSGHPMKAMVPVVDFATALSCALGVLAALYERKSSGLGQKVDASLLQTALNFSSGLLIEEALLGLDRQATGNRSPIAGPSDIFRVADGWIIVQVIGTAMFKRWARLIEAPDLIDDPRLGTDQSRGEHGELLSARMARWCEGRSQQQALSALECAKIPAGPVHSPQQVLEDKEINDSGAFAWMSYPGLTTPAPIVRAPMNLSRTPLEVALRAPTIGEHTDQILSEVGYSIDEVERLRELSII